jgi:hypothetical protein
MSRELNLETHRAEWVLKDANESVRLYACRHPKCEQEFALSQQSRESQPPKQTHLLQTNSPWPLPHMEHTPAEPTPAQLREELKRAADELGNAIYMHRQAWVQARKYADRLADEQLDRNPGKTHRQRAAELAALKETDRAYQRKISDVKFWLAERECHAATISALAALINLSSGVQAGTDYRGGQTNEPPQPRLRPDMGISNRWYPR